MGYPEFKIPASTGMCLPLATGTRYVPPLLYRLPSALTVVLLPLRLVKGVSMCVVVVLLLNA